MEEKREKMEDYLEVDDNEIYPGDQYLKIGLPDKEESQEVESEKKIVEEEEDSPDHIEVDDDTEIDENDDYEQTKAKLTKKNKVSEEVHEQLDENEYSVFGGNLNENGFFPDIEDEEIQSVKSEEELQRLLEKQLNITFQNWQDTYKQKLLDNLVREGIVSKENIRKDLITSYSKEDIQSDLNLAKEIHYEFYKRKGLPDRQIDRIVSAIEDLEESALELYAENEAEKAKEQAAIAAKIKEQEEAAILQRKQFEDKLKETTFNYEEFIPGRKLKQRDKEETFMNIEPVLKKINSDLSKYAPILAYLDRYGILEGKFDKIIKEAETKSVDKLHQILANKKQNMGVSSAQRKSGVINIDDSNLRQIYK
jgi:hypothetical protein